RLRRARRRRRDHQGPAAALRVPVLPPRWDSSHGGRAVARGENRSLPMASGGIQGDGEGHPTGALARSGRGRSGCRGPFMSWVACAFLSALFAGLTALLAKIGVENVPSNLATLVRTVVIVVFAAGIVAARGEWT